VLTPLASNLMAKLAVKNPTILKYDDDHKRMEPRVVIAHLLEQSQVPQWSVQAGDIVAKVNGKPVTALAEFRKAFEPDGDFWTLETLEGTLLVLDFKATLTSEPQLAQIHNYVPSTAVLRTIAEFLPADHEFAPHGGHKTLKPLATAEAEDADSEAKPHPKHAAAKHTKGAKHAPVPGKTAKKEPVAKDEDSTDA